MRYLSCRPKRRKNRLSILHEKESVSMTVESEKALSQCRNRLRELAEKCYMQNVYCFTGFLGMAELDVFYRMERELSHVPFALSGGRAGCERQMIRFGSEETLGYEQPFPIVCLEARPLLAKFADSLTHRDFLGACMNLGIDRSTMGDIVVRDNRAFFYCTEMIAPYLIENLTKVKHTSVTCVPCAEITQEQEPLQERRRYQVASERLDAVVARVCGLSREKSQSLFREKKIFVNGRQQERTDSVPQTGDTVTVRGYGKFIYYGLTHRTKKGKCNIEVGCYI